MASSCLKSAALMTVLSTLGFTSLSHAQLPVKPENQWSFGMDHRSYGIALPSHAKDEGMGFGEDGDVFGIPAAIGISSGLQLNDHAAIIGDAAIGYEPAKAGNELTSYSSDTGLIRSTEDFETTLDYSMSVLAQLRPFGQTPFRPYLVGGLNATSITYDYVIESTDLSSPIKGSETLSSVGLIYGFGFEFNMTDHFEFKLDYQALPHMEETTDMIALGVNYDF